MELGVRHSRPQTIQGYVAELTGLVLVASICERHPGEGVEQVESAALPLGNEIQPLGAAALVYPDLDETAGRRSGSFRFHRSHDINRRYRYELLHFGFLRQPGYTSHSDNYGISVMPGKRHCNETNEHIERLWKLGVPPAAIGGQIGISGAAVVEQAARLNLGPHGGHRVAPAFLVAAADKIIKGKTAPPGKSAWKPIATQHLGGEWKELPDAPWPIDIARRMEADGQLLLAQRREGTNMILVAKEYRQ
jgi:hypothetical protein